MRLRSAAIVAVLAAFCVALFADELLAGKRRARRCNRGCYIVAPQTEPTPDEPAAEPAPPPALIPLGDAPPVLTQLDANYGIDVAQLDRERGRFSITGRPCTKREAIEAAENGLPEDRHKLCLTCFGTKEERERFLAEMQPLAGEVHLQAYAPDDPMVRDLGFARGTPSVYLQRPPATPGGHGPVEFRWETNPGRDVVAAKIEEVRKRDPKYDPAKDPNPKQPGPKRGIKIDVPPLWVIVAIGVLILLRK